MLTSNETLFLRPIRKRLPIFILLRLLGLAGVCLYRLPFALVNRLRGFAVLGHGNKKAKSGR
jgi:hypothetical protein